VITEKIDGTNGQIFIEEWPDAPGAGEIQDGALCVFVDGEFPAYKVLAGSRNRWVTPGKVSDNSGFAGWVFDNAQQLVRILGAGRHYGEWWGQGIQRTYGLKEKRFSLFNTDKWGWLRNPLAREDRRVPATLGVVPVLYEGPFLTREVEDQLFRLRAFGSQCSPGFMDAEGVVVYHVAAGAYFKATCKNDEKPKGVK
jgi:hypothetical protein